MSKSRKIAHEVDTLLTHTPKASGKKSIPIQVIHSIAETDHGPYHQWSMAGSRSARNDEAFAREEAEKTVRDLKGAGIEAHVEVVTRRIPFPRDW